MAIFKDSRYEYVPVYHHYTGMYEENLFSGTSIPTLRRRKLSEFSNTEAVIHTFQLGDRLDLLAYKYYGDAQLWWVILDANPKYMTPFEIPIGVSLLIPPVSAMEGGEI